MQRSQLNSVAELSQLIEEGELSYAAQAIRPVGRARGSHRWFEWLVRPPISDPNLTVRDFILAVESLDLSLDLDTRIVRDALAWLDQQPINTRLCINVSTATLVNRHFSEFVTTALDNSHLLASQVCFDIALSDAEGHFAGVSRFIRVVQARGCEVAVDLAAKGNALLGMLAPLGLVNYLKIDHTCVQAAPTSPAHRELMESLCEYSARLDLPVIAKGVDSDVHRDLLAELGVDYYQGFVDGEPVLVTEPEEVAPVQVIEHSA
ncbi:MAG: EAL domain-containing protein [Pseudomonadota bacterium]